MSAINLLQENISFILERTLLTVPDNYVSEFRVYNAIDYLTNQVNFLVTYFISKGYVPPPTLISRGFYIYDPVQSLQDQIDDLLVYLTPFVLETRWNITASDIVTLTFENSSVTTTTPFDFQIDWGDGTTENYTNSDDVTHTYSQTSTFTMKISGIVPYINFNSSGKLVEVVSLGAIGMESLFETFYQCANLTGVNVTTDTVIELASCYRAWKECTGLTTFDTTGLTSVTDCSEAWYGCTGLLTFDTTGLISVIDGASAWYGCNGLSSFDTTGLTSITDCTFAWRDCQGLATFDAVGLTSVTDCTEAWFFCTALLTFDTAVLTSVTDCTKAWGGCSALTTFDAVGLTSVTDCTGAWFFCTALLTFNTTPLTSIIDCSGAWAGCIGLTTFDTAGLTSVVDCSNLSTTIALGAWQACTGLATFDAIGLISVTNCTGAWVGAGVIPFVLGATFLNYSQLETVTGWAPGTNPPT